MRRYALEVGVRVFEQSKVTCIDRGTTVTLITAQGTMRAPSVVIATNAWAAALRPLRNKLLVISSDMIATEPIADRLDDIGWTQGEAITDSQTLVCYYRTTAEGRIAFGKGGGSIGFDGRIRRAMHHNASRASIVVRDFRRYYPMLRTVKLTHDWAGPIDRTMNSLPIFGRLYEDANIYYGVGWSGNGVGPSVVGGKILAALALGHHNEWSGCGLITGSASSFPPEPIRFVGAHIVKKRSFAKRMPRHSKASTTARCRTLKACADRS